MDVGIWNSILYLDKWLRKVKKISKEGDLVNLTKEDLHDIKIFIQIAAVYGMADSRRVDELVQKLENKEE